MLKQKHGSFHFRKIVPEALRKTLGKREIWLSLGTNRKREALSRACYINGYVTEIFERAGRMTEKWNISNYFSELTRIIRENKTSYRDEIIELRSKYLVDAPAPIVAGFVSQVSERHQNTLNKINELASELEQAKKEGNPEKEVTLLGMLRDAIQRIPTPGSVPMPVMAVQPTPEPQEKSELFSKASTQYIEIKRGSVGVEEIQQIQTASKLFLRFMRDKQLHEYTRKDARNFIELIRNLPVRYGKSPGDGQKTLSQIIEEAKKQDNEYATLSTKTINRHIRNLANIWKYSISSDDLEDKKDNDIWTNHIITPVREELTDRRPFTDNELKILENTPWQPRVHINTVRQILAVASYTGMRLEEICRLRPCDIEKIDGVWCFNIQTHKDEKGRIIWDPKTEAGARIIPLHPFLKSPDLGLIERAENCRKSGKDMIFFDLSYDKSRKKYGVQFSKRFSDFKTLAGLPAETVFHSFRHMVRTKLGHRTGGEKYPTEWIDQILGHESAGQGARYNQGTTVQNLYSVVKTLKYRDWNPMKIMRK